MFEFNSNLYLILISILSFFLSNLVTRKLTPIFKKIAYKFNLFDNPKFRGQHSIPMVRLGGISIYMGYLTSFFLILSLKGFFDISIFETKIFIFIFLTSSLMFTLGLVDDLFQINPYIRLFLQFVIASILFKNGLSIDIIDLTYFNESLRWEMNSFLSFLFTLVWLVGITNSINWIDGLDGLASGIGIITIIGITIFNTLNGNLLITFLSAGMIGSCTGFLKYNSYPAKIFMGDCGSYLIGLFIAVSSCLNLTTSQNPSNLIFILLIISYPILDMFIVILRRIIKHKSPFRPDSSHLHHILRKKNISHSNTVKLLYLLNIFICIISISVAL